MKKIMFNDKYGQTQAVLEGRKTQTRRIIKTKSPVRLDLGKRLDDGSVMCGQLDCTRNCVRLFTDTKSNYKIGEEVAVAQSYFNCGTKWAREYIDIASDLIKSKGYNNKMFVRAYLMPHRIKITNVRVEHLQDISDEDCLKEGIKRKNNRYCVENYKGVCFYTNDLKLAIRCLINKTCGKGTWEKNPYVFVYDFELIK